MWNTVDGQQASGLVTQEGPPARVLPAQHRNLAPQREDLDQQRPVVTPPPAPWRGR